MEENKKTNVWDVLKGYSQEHPWLFYMLVGTIVTSAIKAPAAIINAVKGNTAPATTVKDLKEAVDTVKDAVTEVKPVKK